MAVSPESPAREEEKLRAIRNGTGCFKEIVLSIGKFTIGYVRLCIF
jgi:hypothetical protein